MKRATIADVARLAGVSRSTVSYALSNKRPISNETRQRIQSAIEELGYRPNVHAQRLAHGGKGKFIGFAMPLVSNQILGLELKFITSAANVINLANYNFIMLTHADRNPDNLIQLAQSGLVDGFILLEVYMHDERVKFLQREGIPFVLIGRCEDNTGLAYVDVDIENGMEQSFAHLRALGHRSISYIYKDDKDYGFSLRSLREYHAACQRHNVLPRLHPCALTPEDGEHVMNSLLEQNPDITAAIIWSDIPTLGAVQAVQASGRRIPEDFSIICQEHSIISSLTSFVPAIIDIHPEEMASQAAQLMIDLLEDKLISKNQILIPPELILTGG